MNRAKKRAKAMSELAVMVADDRLGGWNQELLQAQGETMRALYALAGILERQVGGAIREDDLHRPMPEVFEAIERRIEEARHYALRCIVSEELQGIRDCRPEVERHAQQLRSA
jgi:hypothetical protein